MEIYTTVENNRFKGFNKIMYKQPKPIMRQASYTDFRSALDNAIEHIIHDPKTMPYQNCLNCKHWNFGKDLCTKFDAKPPTEIIVYSCPAYEDDLDIPF